MKLLYKSYIRLLTQRLLVSFQDHINQTSYVPQSICVLMLVKGTEKTLFLGPYNAHHKVLPPKHNACKQKGE